MAPDPTTGTSSKPLTAAQRKRARAILRRREAERLRDEKRTQAQTQPVRGENAREKAQTSKPQAVRGETAAEKARAGKQGQSPDRARRDFPAARPNLVSRLAASGRALPGHLAADPNVQRMTGAGRSSPERIVEVVAGQQVAKLLPGGKPAQDADPKWLAAELAMLAPGVLTRGVTAPVRAVRGLRRAETVEEAGGKVRRFREGDLTVEVPAARSRTGRVIERGIDKARPVISKTGLVKSEGERVGYELKRQERLRSKLETAPAGALEKIGRRLSPAEQYALRVLAEETPTAQRIALHSERMGAAASRRERVYHAFHRDAIRKAAKLLDESSGTPRLRDDAPRKLAEAWRLLEGVAGGREEIYRTLGRLTDETIAARIGAPAKVVATGRVLAKEPAPPTPGQMSLADVLPDGAPATNPGRAYVGYRRGVPGLSLRGVGALARSSGKLLGGGSRRTIGAGPKDEALAGEFTGRSILSGRFSTDTTGVVAQGLRTASRLSGAKHMRADLLRASAAAPRAATDIAIREDAFLGKRLPGKLRAMWTEMEAVAAGEQGRRALRRVGELEDEITKAIRQELLADASVAGGKVQGVRWLSREVAESAGLLEVPQATRLVTRGWTRLARGGAQTAGVLFDGINDAMRAAVLYFNPGYAPVQLTQNAVMLVMGQGPLALGKLPRAWRLSSQLAPEDVAKVDSLMQLDRLYEQRLTRLVTQKISDPFARFATMFADLGPRRAAFLNEAAAAGHGTPAALTSLLNDPVKAKELRAIGERANRVMGDFDRLSDFERQYVSRVFWFYPWTNVAFRYTARFPLDHPLQTAAGAYGARELDQRSDRELGPDRPFYAQWYLKVGERDGQPRVVDLGKFFPFTTPAEWGMAAYGLATGRRDLGELKDRLVPTLAALGESMFGPSYGDAYGLPAALKTFGDVPLRNRYENLTMTSEEREQAAQERLRPRTFGESLLQVPFGPLAPTGYNRKVADERARKARRRSLSALQRLDEDFRETLKQARADAARFEVPGGLPKTVAAELRWRHARNRALAKAEDEKGRDLDERERATIAARLLIERYPQARQPVEAALSEARTASDYASLYQRISREATETLRRWNEEMNAAKRESEPALP